MLMAYEEFGRLGKLAALQAAALFLDLAELLDNFLELTGEARAVQAESGEGAKGVNDVKVDGGLLSGRVCGAGKQLGFEERDAVEAPCGVGDFVDELGLCWGGGLVLTDKIGEHALDGGFVFEGDENSGTRKTVREAVLAGNGFACQRSRTR